MSVSRDDAMVVSLPSQPFPVPAKGRVFRKRTPMHHQPTRHRHIEFGHRHRRPRVVAAIAAVVATLAMLLGVTTASSAAAAPIYGNWAITGPYGGLLNDSKGGFLDGIVYFDRSGASSSPYNWIKSSDGYTGPGGRKYHSYKNIDSGRCLSYSGDIVVAVPCQWSDYSQWWSVESVYLGITYPPNGGFPISNYASLMTSWTAPDKVITTQDDLAVLKPRGGTTGSPAQRLKVGQLVIPH
jgi:hypothetical protein